MSEQEKAQWREWFDEHPEWLREVVRFVSQRPDLILKNEHKKWWHDLMNAIVPLAVKYNVCAR